MHKPPKSKKKAQADKKDLTKPRPSYANILNETHYTELQNWAWANRITDKPLIEKDTYKEVYKDAMRRLDEGFGSSLKKLSYDTANFQTLSKLRHDTAKFFGYKHLNFSREVHKVAEKLKTVKDMPDSFKNEFGGLYDKFFQNNYKTQLGAVDLAGQSAKRWLEFQENKADYPNLKYQAVGDGRTRAEHMAWDGIILPIDHPFWQTHFPPNGWKCRCIVVQTDEAVTYTNSSGKLTDPDNPPAFKEGSELFSNNPGLSGKVFNESRYFREAGEGDFRIVRSANIWAVRDELITSISEEEGLKAKNKMTGRTINLTRGAVRSVFAHRARSEKALVYQMLFDFKKLAADMKAVELDVEDKNKKHNGKISSWDYYETKHLETLFHLAIAKTIDGNMILYTIMKQK